MRVRTGLTTLAAASLLIVSWGCRTDTPATTEAARDAGGRGSFIAGRGVGGARSAHRARQGARARHALCATARRSRSPTTLPASPKSCARRCSSPASTPISPRRTSATSRARYAARRSSASRSSIAPEVGSRHAAGRRDPRRAVSGRSRLRHPAGGEDDRELQAGRGYEHASRPRPRQPWPMGDGCRRSRHRPVSTPPRSSRRWTPRSSRRPA